MARIYNFCPVTDFSLIPCGIDRASSSSPVSRPTPAPTARVVAAIARTPSPPSPASSSRRTVISPPGRRASCQAPVSAPTRRTPAPAPTPTSWTVASSATIAPVAAPMSRCRHVLIISPAPTPTRRRRPPPHRPRRRPP